IGWTRIAKSSSGYYLLLLLALSWTHLRDYAMSRHHGASLLPLANRCCAHATAYSRLWRALATAAVDPASQTAVLQSRGVLQAEGPQVLNFLQGIVTNDVRPLENAGPQQPPVYATILTPKGKFLHDVLIFPHPERPDSVLIDVDRSGAAAALQLLNRYKLRRPITFRDVSSQFRVAACWGAAAQPPGPWWRPDPRRPELGFRGLLPASGPSAEQQGAGSGEEEYRALRYRLGVAEGEAEIPAGQAAPLDYNVDVLRGVSYSKGCYVGQERNSFTHYRGVIRRRLMPVRLEPLEQASSDSAAGPPSLACGAEVVDAASGRSVGQLRGTAGATESGSSGARWGIAYLQLAAALPAAEGRVDLRVAAAAAVGGEAGQAGEGVEKSAGTGAAAGPAEAGGSGVWRVVPVRPEWWPAEWGREEEAGRAGGSS
ncbi:hypothetical protein Agub_g13011, partial [Astrephomene gubernaculifera]